MEVTYREGIMEYSHPQTLNPEILDQMFQLIEVKSSSLLNRITGGSSTNQEAFHEKQRLFLATNISSALEQATPLETVTFSWAIPRGNGIWELTSGGLFFLDHKIHLILPNFRQTVAASRAPQTFRRYPLSSLGEPLHSLKVLAPGHQLTHDFVRELWSPQTPHFIFPLKAFSNIDTDSSHQELESDNPKPGSSESIKHRFQVLEKLHKEGLLTEREFQLKRQDILNEL